MLLALVPGFDPDQIRELSELNRVTFFSSLFLPLPFKFAFTLTLHSRTSKRDLQRFQVPILIAANEDSKGESGSRNISDNVPNAVMVTNQTIYHW